MRNEYSGVVAIIIVIAALLAGILFGYQWFRVFSASQAGRAELAQAEFNRQIRVREAQALKDAATLQAEAEVLRAAGIAEANKIIADGLGGPDGYLRYLYIDMLRNQQDKQIIYVPTEAGLPILEAGRRE